MTCSEFEQQIAAESGDPAVAEHLAACAECREFARELLENAASLRLIAADAAAYAAVRARVMEAVRPKRRFAWLWAAVGATATACLAVLWWTAPLRAPAPPPPQAVVFPITVPELTASVERPRPVKRRVRRRVPQEQLAAIKLLTDDPNVVIIWLVNNKKGNSL